jgi:hypothetical protein
MDFKNLKKLNEFLFFLFFIPVKDFAAGVYLPVLYSTPLHTVHVHCSCSYSYRKGGGGGGGGVTNQREEERGNRSQSWVENTNMTDCSKRLAISSL